MRDTQRQRVYDAERSLKATGTPVGKRGSMDEVVAFVSEVVGSAWWQRRSSVGFVCVKDGRGRKNAGAWAEWSGTCYISLPAGWARSRLVILHELAHHLAPGPVGERWAHDVKFAGALLALLDQFGDPGTGEALREAYAEHKVRWRGGVPKATLVPPVHHCAGCDATARRPMPWAFRSGSGGVQRFCTKRCATAWTAARIGRAEPIAARRA